MSAASLSDVRVRLALAPRASVAVVRLAALCGAAILLLAPPSAVAGRARVAEEWTAHRSEDGSRPTPEDQELVYLVNRARSDPEAEGSWLAESPEVQSRFGGFPVDWSLLRAEFSALPARPPLAVDRRVLAGEGEHARAILDGCRQTHAGQRERVREAGYRSAVHRVVAWAQPQRPVWAHAAFQIDFGGPAASGGMQSGRPHRAALMGDSVALGYGSAVGERRSCFPGLVVSGSFVGPAAGAGEPGRFLVGTVWSDANENGRMDAGEGVGGAEIRPVGGRWYAVTAPAGGYALPLESSGEVWVSLSSGEWALLVSREVGAESVLLDWRLP